MSTAAPPTPRWLKWTLLFAFWTLLGVSFAGQFYISSFKAGMSVSWGRAISWALGDWYVFAALSLPVFQLTRRFPITPVNWRKRALGHLGGSVLFSLTYILVRAGVGVLQGAIAGESISFAEAFQPLLVKTWHFNLLIYWVMVSVSHALDHHRKLQERELAAAGIALGGVEVGVEISVDVVIATFLIADSLTPDCTAGKVFALLTSNEVLDAVLVTSGEGVRSLETLREIQLGVLIEIQALRSSYARARAKPRVAASNGCAWRLRRHRRREP